MAAVILKVARAPSGMTTKNNMEKINYIGCGLVREDSTVLYHL